MKQQNLGESGYLPNGENQTRKAVFLAEHPFRVVKRQFGFVKARCRGLGRNNWQIVTLFAQANLWLACKRLLPLLDEVQP